MKYPIISVALAAIGLSGCVGLTGPVIMGADAAGIYASSPGTPPSADLSLQMPPHESWCYSTMGDSQCYAHPQNTVPERLINVDPPNRYPVDLAAYHQALTPPPPPPPTVAAASVNSPPPADMSAEKATLKDEIEQDKAASAPILIAP